MPGELAADRFGNPSTSAQAKAAANLDRNGIRAARVPSRAVQREVDQVLRGLGAMYPTDAGHGQRMWPFRHIAANL